MRKRIYRIILIILILIFLFSAGMIAYHFISRHLYEQDFKKIAKDAPTTEQAVGRPALAIDYYEDLYSQNNDTFCFLTIPDTQVNYPVMRTPSDPQYYLRRDFFKNYSYYGVPFCETRGDLERFEIIYGHHINGKKMFGELINYNRLDYMRAHNKIYLYTEKGVEEYTVFASVYTTGDDPKKLFATPINGIYSYDEFKEYIGTVAGFATAVDSEALPEYGSKILMLATCEYSRDDGRYIVYAAKKGM